MSFDYLYYRNVNPARVDNIYLDRNGSPAILNDTLFPSGSIGYAHTPIKSFVAKLDYLRQISKKVKLESGVKETWTINSSESTIESQLEGSWVALADESNNLSMKERIDAAYATTTIQFNPLTSLSVGLRYEYSHTHLNDLLKDQVVVDRTLSQLFPDIFFSKKVNDHSTLQVSFSRRISRPSYNDLASFISYNDFVSVFTGNPSLHPTITQNLKFGYVFKGSSFSVLVGRDDYPIAQAQVVTSPTKRWLYIGPQNLQYQNNLTFQADIPLKVGNWWKMNYGMVGGWRQFKIDYTVIPVQKTYFGYSMYSTQTFVLPVNFGAELSGNYVSPFYSGSVRLRGFYTVNAGIKKVFGGNGGTVQFSVEDLFRSYRLRSAFGFLTEEAFNLQSHLSFSPESRLTRIYKLSYSRSFGKKSVRERKDQSSGYQDEDSRVRKY
jgi:outer membrane receptor protein involved in Fe transport